jgi:putative DNA primase/helicase
MRAKLAEARIAARDQALVDNADPATVAEFSNIAVERAAAEAEVDAWSGPAPDPDHFIDKRDGLQAVRLAVAVQERVTLGRMAVQGDSDALDPLWRYANGVWTAGGEKAAAQEVVRLLGERHRRSHIGNVLDVLRADSTIQAIAPDAPHPEFVNFANGMLELSTGRLVDHAPTFGSTVQIPHPWHPEATCPTVEAWFAEVLPDAGMSGFMFAVLGYLLVNGNPWHRAFLLVGSGRNGKSTFLRLAEQMLGSNNVSNVPLDRIADGHRFASAEMFMRTANVCGDLAATHLKDTSTFKQLTGGDPVFAERKMRDPFSFTWWGVPIFSANAVPGADDTSHGFMSRWEIVRFPVDLTGRCDPGIESRLLSELPGVIVRAVDALRQALVDGDFSRPPAVIEAKAEFARSLDQVRGYLADWTTSGGWTKRDRVYADYKQWALQHGHGELNARKFYDRLRSAGVAELKRKGDRGFTLTLGQPSEQQGAEGAGTPSPVARTGEREEYLPQVPPPAPALTDEDLGPLA